MCTSKILPFKPGIAALKILSIYRQTDVQNVNPLKSLPKLPSFYIKLLYLDIFLILPVILCIFLHYNNYLEQP